MYSLVNVSVLCLDFACHPRGYDVAVALDRALRLRPGELPALEAAFRDDPSRTAAWAEVADACGRASRLTTAVAGAAEAVRTFPPRSDLVDRVELLRRTPLGGLSDLLAMVRGDVLDWTWQRAGG